MESKTKREFSADTIQQLVKSQFGSAVQIAKISSLTDGWFNTAYAIQFSDENPAAVLRIAPDPKQRLLTYEDEMMRKELLVYEIIANAVDSGAVNMRVPRLLGADTSRTIINCDFMFVEKFSGRPMEELKDQLSPADLQLIHRQIGIYTAELHAIKNDAFGYIGGGPGDGETTWRAAFSAFIEALLDDGESLDVDLPFSYQKIRELFQQNAPLLDEIRTPVLVHWDLWPVNIFLIKQNGRFEVEGIIDWERAYWGDPESEPAIAMQHYGTDFSQGYGRELTTGENAVMRRKLYLIYLLLVMKIEAKVRFENAEHLTWVEAELTKALKDLEQCSG